MSDFGDGSGGRVSQPRAVIRSKLRWTHPIHVDDFKLLKSLTTAVPKITIPGPCALHFRGGDAAVTAHAYRDVDEFWSDTVKAYHDELAALAAAGCTYVQIDETAFAKFGDPAVQATLAARGDDWRRLIDVYIDVTNRVLRGANGIRVGMHLCRGNRGGHWHAEGSYDLVADKLFNALDIDVFFLEYDSPRAGDFSPLRLRAQGENHRARTCVDQSGDGGGQGGAQAAHRGGQPPCRSRSAGIEPAMRICQLGGGQSDPSGRAGSETSVGGRGRARRLGRKLSVAAGQPRAWRYASKRLP